MLTACVYVRMHVDCIGVYVDLQACTTLNEGYAALHSLSWRSHAPASAGVVVAEGLASLPCTPAVGFEARKLIS